MHKIIIRSRHLIPGVLYHIGIPLHFSNRYGPKIIFSRIKMTLFHHNRLPCSRDFLKQFQLRSTIFIILPYRSLAEIGNADTHQAYSFVFRIRCRQ